MIKDADFFEFQATDQSAPRPTIFQDAIDWLRKTVPLPRVGGVPLGQAPGSSAATPRPDIAGQAGNAVSSGAEILSKFGERAAWGLLAILLLGFGLYALTRK